MVNNLSVIIDTSPTSNAGGLINTRSPSKSNINLS